MARVERKQKVHSHGNFCTMSDVMKHGDSNIPNARDDVAKFDGALTNGVAVDSAAEQQQGVGNQQEEEDERGKREIVINDQTFTVVSEISTGTEDELRSGRPANSERKAEEENSLFAGELLESKLASISNTSDLNEAFPDFNWDDFEVVDECDEGEEEIPETKTPSKPEKKTPKSPTKPDNRNRIISPKPSPSSKKIVSSRPERSRRHDEKRRSSSHGHSSHKDSARESAATKKSLSRDRESKGRNEHSLSSKKPKEERLGMKSSQETSAESEHGKEFEKKGPDSEKKNSHKQKEEACTPVKQEMELQSKKHDGYAETEKKDAVPSAEGILKSLPSITQREEVNKGDSAVIVVKEVNDDILDIGVSADDRLLDESEMDPGVSSEVSIAPAEQPAEALTRPLVKKDVSENSSKPGQGEHRRHLLDERPKPQRETRDRRREHKRPLSSDLKKETEKKRPPDLSADIKKQPATLESRKSTEKKRPSDLSADTKKQPATLESRKSTEKLKRPADSLKKQPESPERKKSMDSRLVKEKEDESEKTSHSAQEDSVALVPKRSEPLPEITAYVESLIGLEYDVRKYTCFYCNNVCRWRRCLDLAGECSSESGKAAKQKEVEAYNDNDNVVVGASHVVEVCDTDMVPRCWVCVLCNAVCNSVELLLGHLTSFLHIDNHMERVEPSMYRPPCRDEPVLDSVRQPSAKIEHEVMEQARAHMEKHGCGLIRKYVGEKFADWPDVLTESDENEMEETVLTDKMELLFSDDTRDYPLKYKIIPSKRSVANSEYSMMTVDSNNTMIGMQYMLEIWAPSRRVVPVYYCTLCDYLITNWTVHCTILKHCATYLKKHYKTVYECVLLESGCESEFRTGLTMARERILLLEGRQSRVCHVLQLLGHLSDVFVAVNGKIAKLIVEKESLQIPPPPRAKKRPGAKLGTEPSSPSKKFKRPDEVATGKRNEKETGAKDKKSSKKDGAGESGQSKSEPAKQEEKPRRSDMEQKNEGVPKKTDKTKEGKNADRREYEGRKVRDEKRQLPAEKKKEPEKKTETEKKEPGKEQQSEKKETEKKKESEKKEPQAKNESGKKEPEKKKELGKKGETEKKESDKKQGQPVPREPRNEKGAVKKEEEKHRESTKKQEAEKAKLLSQKKMPKKISKITNATEDKISYRKKEFQTDGKEKKEIVVQGRVEEELKKSSVEQPRSSSKDDKPSETKSYSHSVMPETKGREKDRHAGNDVGVRKGGNGQERPPRTHQERPRSPVVHQTSSVLKRRSPTSAHHSSNLPKRSRHEPPSDARRREEQGLRHRRNLDVPRPQPLMGTDIRPPNRHEERRLLEKSGALGRRRPVLGEQESRREEAGRAGRDRRRVERDSAHGLRRVERDTGQGLSREDLRQLEDLLRMVDPAIMASRTHLNHSDVEMLRYRMGSETVDALLLQIRSGKHATLTHY